MNILANRRVKDIWETFSGARKCGLIHNFAEEPTRERLIYVGGRPYVNFVTCSYLGLECDPRIIAGIVSAATRHGASLSVSRTYLTSSPYAELQQLLARLFGNEVVVTPSTTLAHFAFATTMIQAGDVIILDQQVHNSVQMAVQSVASKVRLIPLRHNDMERLCSVSPPIRDGGS